MSSPLKVVSMPPSRFLVLLASLRSPRARIRGEDSQRAMPILTAGATAGAGAIAAAGVVAKGAFGRPGYSL